MDRSVEISNAIKAILEEGMKISHLGIDEEESHVTVIIGAPKVDPATEKKITRAIAKVVKIDFGFKGLKATIEAPKVRTDAVTNNIKYITVTSGKGGVGKSTVAANLAVALARVGKKVGIIDADVYGPSLPKIFGIDEPQLMMSENQKIIPMKTEDGVTIMSTEFVLEDDKPLMWRGPMLGRMIAHFFNDVVWDEDMEYIIVDLPPGTGDIPLDIKELIPQATAIVVTTPHPMASHIATKSGEMARHLGHEILGVVENMSYYTNPVNGAEEKIFGSGGAEMVANNLDTEVLAEIPIAQVKAGHSHGIFAIHEENGISYLGLANKVMKKVQEATN